MKTKTVYVASDGTEYDDQSACEAQEQSLLFARLEGLEAAEVRAAVAGEDRGLSAVLEKVGAMCAKARLAGGGSKRKRKAAEPVKVAS